MTPRSRGRLVAVIVAGVLAVALAFVAGRLTAPSIPVPSSGSAAAGFLRDMQVHHSQGVEMALLIRDRTDDETLRMIAYDMAVTQSQQGGQMYGLLEAWDLPQYSPADPMEWMSQPTVDGSAHDHEVQPDGRMPGLASEAEMAELRAATGLEAEVLFLELMIVHHRGGVEMAEGVLARTNQPQVLSLARGVVTAQEAEIHAMQELLAARR